VALLSVSPQATPVGSSVLVAGCGTGAELLEARAQRPDWRLTATDPSPSMLAVARERLATATDVEWRQSTVEMLEATNCFDGAMAVLVLQSLPDDGAKLDFLTALAQGLRPGGQLVLVDLMRPERTPLQHQIDRAWLEFQKASDLQAPAEGLSGLSDGLHPIGRARMSALAEAAGFGDPAPVFKALDFEGFLLQRRS
jgi:tRNA (cmo5U34)-methyltransferase